MLFCFVLFCFPGLEPAGSHELCHQEGRGEMYGNDHLGRPQERPTVW